MGLAADAAGLGDPDAAHRLLAAAGARAHPSWRPAVRADWVRAELALFTGRAADAVDPAERALAASRAAGSARHVLKSRLVRAVVEAVLHPNGAVLAELDSIASTAARDVPPLQWPALLAAADLAERLAPGAVTGSSLAANERDRPSHIRSPNGRRSGAARRRHAAAVSVNALYQLSDGPGRRLMGDSPYVPQRLPLV